MARKHGTSHNRHLPVSHTVGEEGTIVTVPSIIEHATAEVIKHLPLQETERSCSSGEQKGLNLIREDAMMMDSEQHSKRE